MFLVLSRLLSKLVKSVLVLMLRKLVLVLLMVTVFCVLISLCGLSNSSSNLSSITVLTQVTVRAHGILETASHNIVLLT